MRLNTLIAPLIAAACLTACATPTSSAIYTDTERLNFNGYKSSAWVSDKFTGEHSRQIRGDTLYYTMTQSAKEGGLDVGLSQKSLMAKPVPAAIKNLSVCSSYTTNLSGEGRWWAGPKISVNWQGIEEENGNGDDWYENYIVEIASSTPDELHDIFTGDYFKAEELPSTRVAGSTYRHYKIRFHSWWQFWSVRQDYRESGTLPIAPIVEVWIDNGLPTHRLFDGVKANIETYGALTGTGQMRVDITADPSKTLVCD